MSGSISAHRADSRETVRRILVAADQVLEHQADATLQQIADHAGIDRTTLHRRFRTRDSLIAALLSAAENELLAVLAEPLALPARQAFDALTQRLIEVKDRWGYGVTQLARHPEGSAGIDRLVERVSGWQRAGLLRDDVPVGWFVTTFLEILRSAAVMVREGKLEATDSSRLVASVLLDGYGARS